jgi:hypothetical protein
VDDRNDLDTVVRLAIDHHVVVCGALRPRDAKLRIEFRMAGAGTGLPRQKLECLENCVQDALRRLWTIFLDPRGDRVQRRVPGDSVSSNHFE